MRSSRCKGDKSLIEITNTFSPRYLVTDPDQHFNDKIEDLKHRHAKEMQLLSKDKQLKLAESKKESDRVLEILRMETRERIE